LGGTPVIPPAPTPVRSQPLARAETAALPTPIAAGFEDVREAIAAAVTQARPMLGAILERAVALVVDGGTLVVTFRASDAGVRRVLVTDENVRSIEAIAAQTLGRPLALRVEVSSERVETRPAAPGSAMAVTGPNAAWPSLESTEESRQALTARALKDPAVSRLLTEFGAQVLDVRPLRPGVDGAGSSLGVEENG